MRASDTVRYTYPGLLDRQVHADLAICNAGCYRRVAGHRCERKVVTEYQVAYCVEGCGFIRCDGRTVAVRKGSVFVNIPGHAHVYWTADDEPWTLWWVHFVGGSAARAFRLMRCRPARSAFFIGFNNRLVDLFKDMLRELSRPEKYHQVCAVAYLHLILATIASLRQQSRGADGRGRVRKQIDMRRLDRHIAARLPDVTLPGLAAEAGVSIPYFERLFRDATGYSPLEYVTRRRIGKACNLLATGSGLCVKEVATQAGYRDQHYFSRAFKKITGLSPLRYRRQYGRESVGDPA